MNINLLEKANRLQGEINKTEKMISVLESAPNDNTVKVSVGKNEGFFIPLSARDAIITILKKSLLEKQSEFDAL